MTTHMGANALVTDGAIENNTLLLNVREFKEDPVLLDALVLFSETVRNRIKKAYPVADRLNLLGLSPDFEVNIVSIIEPDADGFV